MRAKIEIPDKLIPVFEGEADVRGAYGGRGSGKTRTFAKLSAIRTHMWDRAGREGIILCGRQFMNSLADSSMEEIKAAIRDEPWLEPHFDIGEKYIRTKSGSIHYVFAGLDRSLDAIKSKSRILLAWVDEAEPVTDEAWTKLIPTLREEDSELWVTWNPESKRSATHRRFRMCAPDPRIKVAEINWRDNPWFPSTLERTRQRDLRDRPEQCSHIWEGDFATAVQGAYYLNEMLAVRTSGRLTRVPYDKQYPVYTGWDLGIDDATAVWFAQIVGLEIRIIDYLECTGRALTDVAKIVMEKPYIYAMHHMPHDVGTREITSAKTRKETLESIGLRPIGVGTQLPVADGINAVRGMLPKCVFDATKCELGIEALQSYRVEIDEDKDTPKQKPRHDWASHGADAFRELAVQMFDVAIFQRQRHQAEVDYDVMDYGVHTNVQGGDEWRPW